MTIPDWLELAKDKDKYALEAAEVLRDRDKEPGAWWHDWVDASYTAEKPVYVGMDVCLKCKACPDDAPVECPVPDPIPTEGDAAWGYAMRLRDELIKENSTKYMKSLSEVCDRISPGISGWVIVVEYAQPHHYVIAAILAGEGE